MSAARAARRRAAKEAAKRGDSPADQRITLANPMSEHYGAFIFGNAQVCERVVEQDSAKGQHLILCGAGPSLADTAAEWCPQGDQVWGCNSAMTWLHDHGHPVTHGFSVDQTPHMLHEWASAPDVEYLVASTIHPHLTEYLLARGRRLRWFHNYVGIRKPPVQYGVCPACDGLFDKGPDGAWTLCADLPAPPAAADCPHETIDGRLENYEDWLYLALYPGTIRAGSGLNSVTRAIDVALFMGFETITVLGGDCSMRVTRPPPKAPQGSPEHLDWLRTCTVMHADGGHALASGATPVTLGGMIDGVYYETKPDMAESARWLEVMRRQSKGRIRLIGDGLAPALKDKPDEFLHRLPCLVDSNGKPCVIDLGGR